MSPYFTSYCFNRTAATSNNMATGADKYKVNLPKGLRAGKTQDFDRSLLSRLGGEDALEAIVDKFVESVAVDDELKPFFERVNKKFLKAHQKSFLTAVFTEIPKDFDVKAYIIERHHKLFNKGVTEKHFDLIVQHLEEALAGCRIDPRLITETKDHLAPFREVFETTKRDDILDYLRESVGSQHQSKIQEARKQRQKEIEKKSKLSLNSITE
jgi:hemoglobin